MTEISKVLISNRGEIACRILRSLDCLDIPGVVVYHAVDAGSPAVQMATEAVEIDGPSPVAAYLDVAQIIDACRRTNVLAAMQAGVEIHEGVYGGLGGQPANFLDGVPVRGTGEYYYKDPNVVGLVSLEDMCVMMDEPKDWPEKVEWTKGGLE